MMVLALTSAVASALVATPMSAPFQSQLPSSSVHMSVHGSRRAVLAGAVAAAVPLVVSAKASLQTDEKVLVEEEKALKALDAEIKKDRKLAFEDEIALSKANDAYLEALKKGDKKKAGELRAQIKEIQGRYLAEENLVKSLESEETTLVAAEQEQSAKIKADLKIEKAEEAKELLEVQQAALAKLGK